MDGFAAFKVDAFTKTPYEGNIAGVVPDADELSETLMQAIAREMNVSETAFILRPTVPGAAWKLRFFTPTSEIRLCGHATVASFHILMETGLVKAPARVAVETNVGVLDVLLREDGSAHLTSDPLTIDAESYDRAAAARFLGLPTEDVLDPVVVIRRTLFARVSGLAAMKAAKPDLRALLDDSSRIDGVVPVSLETSDAQVLTRIRFFAPALGIDEDPVTGTAHMSLAAYLKFAGLLADGGKFVGEQGIECGRPGRVHVELLPPADNVLRATAGGHAVTTMSGRLRAP